MAKGDWLALPFEAIARSAKALRGGEYNPFEGVMLLAGLVFLGWLVQIRGAVIDGDATSSERIVRYPFGACILGVSIWLFVMAVYMGGAD